jgi:hypothetical protein
MQVLQALDLLELRGQVSLLQWLLVPGLALQPRLLW